MKRTWLVAALGAVAFVTSIDSAGAATYAVGHTVKTHGSSRHRAERAARGRRPPLVPGGCGQRRCAPLTVYRSALYGKPLAGTVGSAGVVAARPGSRARTRPVESAAKPFPVIVFSHGSVNDPMNEATMLELIARRRASWSPRRRT